MKKRKTNTLDEPKVKTIGLFDHIKHICKVQDPDYYKNLSDGDKKTFNHFMILKSLSMNPDLIDDVGVLFKYFDIIPSEQFYQLLIAIIPINKNYYPWIKGEKKYKFDDKVIDYISRKFEISSREAIDYAVILNETNDGIKYLKELIRGFGNSEKEVEKLLKEKDNEKL